MIHTARTTSSGGLLLLVVSALSPLLGAQDVAPVIDDYARDVRPVLAEFCFECHGPDEQKSDLRLDTLDPDTVAGEDVFLWEIVREVLGAGEMPPSDAAQPADAQRRTLTAWLDLALGLAARSRQGEREVVLRRLTRAQYANTLQELLGVGVDFGRALPADAKSETGFSNNGAVLQSSPLHLESWQQVARQALELAIRPGPPPPVTRYRVTFGRGIGVGEVAGRTGGYQSVPLDTDQFRVEILGADGEPKVGATPEEQQALDDIKRRISVGLRGSATDRFQVVDEGMILFGALPHVERVPKSWQGPSPNLKLELQRVFPEHGDFVMRVRASRGYIPPLREQMLLELDEPRALAALAADDGVVAADAAQVFAARDADRRDNLREQDGFLVPVDVPQPSSARLFLNVPEAGFYQFDLVHPPLDANDMPQVRLQIDGMKLDLRPEVATGRGTSGARAVTPLGAAGLRAGRHRLLLGGPFFAGFSHLVATPLGADHALVRRLRAQADAALAALQDRAPVIRTLVGTRTDDGMDYATFDAPQEVHAPLGEPADYTFRGRLENLPIPEPASGDTEILSGFMLLGLWNDHLVKSSGETGPPLLVRSIEFEAPYHPRWPPPSHTAIFFDSPLREQDPGAYTEAVLERFVTRAFRRPARAGEVERYLEFWRSIRGDFACYEEGVREVLVAVLCSPKMLHLVEPDPEAVTADEAALRSQYALASRLSYFLWNGPPDAELLELAATGRLHDELLAQVDRMLDDARSRRFVRAFSREWLRLDRLEQISIDVDRFPAFTRFVKRDMREECYRFVEHVLREDLPLTTLIDSDFALLNQNLAEFYGIDGVYGPQFRPVPLTPEQGRGGLLAQGAFLAGHSDGTWPHPIKRAVWVKEKVLGEHPPPPPPNVPDLESDTPGFAELSIKEQLELHRNKASCMDCHRRIDPYGFVFEEYSAVGLPEDERRGTPVDTATRLPDGTELDGVGELKQWLSTTKRDAVARAFVEYVFAYALGRDVHLADEPELRRILREVRISGYRMRAVIRSIVASPSFSPG